MGKYLVKITDDALAEMEEIFDYIENELSAPESARKQYNRIAEAILSLEDFPERFSVFDAEPERLSEIRKMTVDNYLVCYVVDPGEVTVIAVLYGASDIPAKLREKI